MLVLPHVFAKKLYLMVELNGSETTNRKQEKIFFTISCLSQILNPGPFSPESIAVPIFLPPSRENQLSSFI